MIPFMNVLYNNLNGKKEKQILILTGLIIAFVPAVVNIYRFDSLEWWLCPSTNNFDVAKILPTVWDITYIFTYYFTGCYLKEFPITLKWWKKLIALTIGILLFGGYNYWRCYGSVFASQGTWNSYWSLFTFIVSALTFSCLVDINIPKCPMDIRSILKYLSDACLGSYLVSWIFDKEVYTFVNEIRVVEVKGIKQYFFTVPFVFVASICLSLILNKLYSLIVAVVIYTNKIVKH